MKKVTALVLTFVLMLTVTVTAAAQEENGTYQADVTAQYDSGSTAPTVYSMDVIWGAMTFSYEGPGTLAWDPENHSYLERAEGCWSAEGNDVTVVNHSNAEVTVSFAYTAMDSYEGISGSFDQKKVVLDSAVNTTVENAPSETVYLTLSGELNEDDSNVIVGKVTVNLNQQ